MGRRIDRVRIDSDRRAATTRRGAGLMRAHRLRGRGRPTQRRQVTLVNTMVGDQGVHHLVAPNTTRHNMRGVLHRPEAQVVLVDTPGLHRPKDALGER